jgi:hypothetical protein
VFRDIESSDLFLRTIGTLLRACEVPSLLLKSEGKGSGGGSEDEGEGRTKRLLVQGNSGSSVF